MNTNGKSILVLGGSGFISRKFVDSAIESGHKVWTLTRGKRDLHPGATNLLFDRNEVDSLDKALKGITACWDMVVDFIAYQPRDIECDLNVLGSRVRHFVLISTDMVYHPQYRSFPQGVEAERYCLHGYGGNKRASEVRLTIGESPHIPWTILRLTSVMGPGSKLGIWPNALRDDNLVNKIMQKQSLKLVGRGMYLTQPVFVQDVVSIIQGCLDNQSCHYKIFNIAGREIIEAKRYYEILGQLLGYSVNIADYSQADFIRQHPEMHSLICHRFYKLDNLTKAMLPMPAFSLGRALEIHLKNLLNPN